MADEVLIKKAASIARCVERVREDYVGYEEVFEIDFTRQDAIILNLQRACEAAIDLANRIIKLRRLRYPKDSKETFRILAETGLLDPMIATTMGRMVGFRNIAVHQYQELDLAKVRAIIESRLDDLLTFSRALLAADPSAARARGTEPDDTRT
jgi:uncharacterized protein YutE (UPF0331/DUF86 family)